MSLPLIGLSLDRTDDARGEAYALHQLRAAYVDAVAAGGGAPLLLAPSAGAADSWVDAVLDRLDGLLLTGGAFDVPPALYGEAPAPRLGPLKPERTAFERLLLRGARARELPVLGICGGMQLINVELGGSLYQHLPDDLPQGLEHEQPGDRRLPAHPVQVVAGSRLAGLLGAGALAVNTSHHQGVKRLGQGLVASAHSPDGLVEAFEAAGTDWLFGVEWHPELLWDSEPRHRGLFHGLAAAAGAR